jgi:hypothetical protein
MGDETEVDDKDDQTQDGIVDKDVEFQDAIEIQDEKVRNDDDIDVNDKDVEKDDDNVQVPKDEEDNAFQDVDVEEYHDAQVPKDEEDNAKVEDDDEVGEEYDAVHDEEVEGAEVDAKECDEIEVQDHDGGKMAKVGAGVGEGLTNSKELHDGTFAQTMASTKKEEWLQAVNEQENENIVNHGVFEINQPCDLPKGAKVLSITWVSTTLKNNN